MEIPQYLKTCLGWILADEQKRPFGPDGNYDGWNKTRYSYLEVANKGFDIGLQPLDDLAVIDIDGCIDINGNISRFAQDIISKCNSYTEISKSGKGVHIWVRHGGQLKTRVREGFEIYAGSRYAIVTGDKLSGEDINIIDFNFDECFKVKAPTRPNKYTADPHAKPGLIGAFCRAYDIHEAMEMLPDIYTKVDEDRYHYKPSQSAPGVVTYENKWMISNHATDPATGGQHNAFDLILIHKYNGSKDAMFGEISKDKKVRAELLKEFDDEPWVSKLQITKNGGVKINMQNIILILENKFDIRYNMVECAVEILDPPWYKRTKALENSDFIELKYWFEVKHGFTKAGKIIEDCVYKVARGNAYNPIIERLEAMPKWDGIKRAETLLIDCFGAEDDPYTRAVTRKFLAGAVARAYNPGVKFDGVLALIGAQGLKKSTFLNKLALDFFTDDLDLQDVKGKTAAEKIQGKWIIEIGEMVGLRKADVSAVKSFITRLVDRFRPAYGRVPEEFPRYCVFAATGNEDTDFLRDPTGNRRWWVVRCEKQWKDFDVDQVWAEVLTYWKDEQLYLTGEVEKAALMVQNEYTETDIRVGIVEEYIKKLIPENWYDLSMDERKYHTGDNGTMRRKTISIIEIWAECFKNNIKDISDKDVKNITKILRNLGLTAKKRQVLKHYGRVRLWSIPKSIFENDPIE
jgi:predicted P-loop ATPase